jgi:hypothetical protein
MLRPYQNYLRPFQSPPKRDKKKAALWLLAFGTLFAATEDLLQSHTTMLINGSLTPNQWGASVLATLGHSHAVAYSQGAQSLGGDVTPAEAQILLADTMAIQAQFLSEFIENLEIGDPRYRKTLDELYPDIGTNEEIEARIKKGELAEPTPVEPGSNEYWNEKAINQRLDLYNERVRGTANWGAVDMLLPTEEIYWRLDNNENHCDTCPPRSKQVYVKGTLPAVPGDGNSECGVRCRCWLELQDGSIIQF